MTSGSPDTITFLINPKPDMDNGKLSSLRCHLHFVSAAKESYGGQRAHLPAIKILHHDIPTAIGILAPIQFVPRHS